MENPNNPNTALSVCVRACVRACMHTCVCTCSRVCGVCVCEAA